MFHFKFHITGCAECQSFTEWNSVIFSNKNGSAEYEEFVKDLGHHICKEGIKNITSTNPGIFYYSTPINSIFQLGN